MVKLWTYIVENAINGATIGDVPERYRNQVKNELGIAQ